MSLICSAQAPPNRSMDAHHPISPLINPNRRIVSSCWAICTRVEPHIRTAEETSAVKLWFRTRARGNARDAFVKVSCPPDFEADTNAFADTFIFGELYSLANASSPPARRTTPRCPPPSPARSLPAADHATASIVGVNLGVLDNYNEWFSDYISVAVCCVLEATRPSRSSALAFWMARRAEATRRGGHQRGGRVAATVVCTASRRFRSAGQPSKLNPFLVYLENFATPIRTDLVGSSGTTVMSLCRTQRSHWAITIVVLSLVR